MRGNLISATEAERMGLVNYAAPRDEVLPKARALAQELADGAPWAIRWTKLAVNKAINKKDFEAASVHLGDKYIQHNPLAADGPEGLKAFLEFAKKNLATYQTEFKRVLADGDFVVVHAHAKANPADPNDRGTAVMDIFRLENGKVVEHWDVAQPVPEKAMNSNTMF